MAETMNKVTHTPLTLTASIGTKGARVHVNNDANHPLSFGFNWSEYDPQLAADGPALARLIVVAPDLLAACKLVMEACEKVNADDSDNGLLVMFNRLGFGDIFCNGFSAITAAVAAATSPLP